MDYPGIGNCEVIYAVGDIHGRADLLDRFHGRIAEDAAARPDAKPLEIYLGDYIDRGPDSAGVIARLRHRTETHDVVCLAGNHEAMLLDAIDGKLPLGHWLDNGGDATLASYGVRTPAAWSTGRSCLDALPPDDVAFLRGLKLTHRQDPYFFVHAGVRPGISLDQQDSHDLVWIREGFLDFRGPLWAVVVHGHTPRDEPDFQPNRINIDTGAVFSGRLTCLRIDRDGARIL